MEDNDKKPSTLQKVVENLTHPVSSGTSKEIPAGAFEAGSNIREVDFKKNPKKLNYFYVLTPEGIATKTKLTVNFMKKKMREYDELKKELEE